MPESPPRATVSETSDAWAQYGLCPQHDPELWHAPERLSEGGAICAQCPVIRECASHALQLAAQYRLSGTWAGVQIPDDINRSAYRNRLKRLRHVAATGTQLPTRNRRPRVPA